jgi:hypothetical protein
MATARVAGSAAHTTRVERVGGCSTTRGGAAGVVGAVLVGAVLVLAVVDVRGGVLVVLVPVVVGPVPEPVMLVGVVLVGGPGLVGVPLLPVGEPGSVGPPVGGDGAAEPVPNPAVVPLPKVPLEEVSGVPAPSGVEVQDASRPASTRAVSSGRAADRLERDRWPGRGGGAKDIGSQ